MLNSFACLTNRSCTSPCFTWQFLLWTTTEMIFRIYYVIALCRVFSKTVQWNWWHRFHHNDLTAPLRRYADAIWAPQNYACQRIDNLEWQTRCCNCWRTQDQNDDSFQSMSLLDCQGWCSSGNQCTLLCETESCPLSLQALAWTPASVIHIIGQMSHKYLFCW